MASTKNKTINVVLPVILDRLPNQSNPIRTAAKASNTVVCYNCNQPGHIQPNCPFPDKDRRVAGARIEEVILEEDEGQIEEFDKDTPHPEEQQDRENQPEEDDQQYHFDDDEYETRSIDNEVVHVNAIIKDSGYNDCLSRPDPDLVLGPPILYSSLISTTKGATHKLKPSPFSLYHLDSKLLTCSIISGAQSDT
ncbi:hypothetical protein M422DRAFT_276227 [Sphaerobolus stellatus SS14]|uniref:CCHC-type domain-containing protein n=1 Tax=Sphaerobolus stellatus (strain SS14) TaxID=990650 RepID=A0A0C9UDM7_SPHS4|nr:hypothetical protein M422DRAFT_276227 [Sphaerobolus stellatus SS14]